MDSLQWWDYLVCIILVIWLASRLGFLHLARDMPDEKRRIWRSLMGWAIVVAAYYFGRFVH